jgi:hypothetical protein
VTQADLLDLSRSSLYDKAAGPPPDEIAIKHRIDEIYTRYPFDGSRRMAVLLQREGRQICRNTVHRYMRQMGIAAIYPGPNLSRRELAHRIYPYLLRGLPITAPIRSGALTSLTSAYSEAGCIWSRFLTGTRATSSVGSWTRLLSNHLS